MKPLSITMLLIVAGTLAANTVHAQTTKLPDDVRRALPTTSPAEPKPAAPAATEPSNLAAESDSAEELLKQALLRYQNIALQSDGLTEQFLKELNERIARLESTLGTTQAPSPKKPVAEKPSATNQPSAQPQPHVVLRPSSPQPSAPASGSETVKSSKDVSSVPQAVTPDTTARRKVKLVPTERDNALPATSADELNGVADAFDAAAENYERLAEQFRQHANRLRKPIRVNEAHPPK